MQRTRTLFPHWLSLACLALAGEADLSTQPLNDGAIDSAIRDARKYGDCLESHDAYCFDALTNWELFALTWRPGLPGREALRTANDAAQRAPDMSGRRIRFDTPWPTTASGEQLYVLIPYLLNSASPSGAWLETRSYLIGASEDSGKTWQFVSAGNSVRRESLLRLMPGYRDKSLPEYSTIVVYPPGPERSKYFQTEEGAFTIDDGMVRYAMRFSIRKRIEEDVDVIIAFDDPAQPTRPRTIRAVLESGQESVEIVSPAMTGFEGGNLYKVALYGSDRATGAALFEHRQQLLFSPSHNSLKLLRTAESLATIQSTEKGL